MLGSCYHLRTPSTSCHFERVCKPICVVKLSPFIGEKTSVGGRGRFVNGAVNLIPDEHIVWIDGKNGIQERYNTVEVDVIGVDGGAQSR